MEGEDLKQVLRDLRTELGGLEEALTVLFRHATATGEGDTQGCPGGLRELREKLARLEELLPPGDDKGC